MVVLDWIHMRMKLHVGCFCFFFLCVWGFFCLFLVLFCFFVVVVFLLFLCVCVCVFFGGRGGGAVVAYDIHNFRFLRKVICVYVLSWSLMFIKHVFCLIPTYLILIYLILSYLIRGDVWCTVSKSAFLTCQQCYCAGSSLAWGLNLRA